MRNDNYSDIDIDGTVTKLFLKYHEQTLSEKVQQEILEFIKKSEIEIVYKNTGESTTMEKMAEEFFDTDQWKGSKHSNKMDIENISTLEFSQDTKQKAEDIPRFYRILIAIICTLIFFSGALLFAMLMSYLFDPPKVTKTN